MQWQLSNTPHQPAKCQHCWALEQPRCYFWTHWGMVFPWDASFLLEKRNQSAACCPGAVRVSISSPSSPGLDTHPGEASTACPDLCLMWKQRQKSYINLSSPFGIIFSECTSPLLPLGPAKGLWAGRQGNSPSSTSLLSPKEQHPQVSVESGRHPPLVCATSDMPLAGMPSLAP